MSIENKLKDLISQLEAGYITRGEFDRLKSKMLDAEQSATVSVGQNFREYFVESLIGEGGMGAVYKVRHRTSFEAQGYRALKVIKPDLLADSKFRARFVAEANKGMKLNHPNVARVYDLFEEGEGLYILMEFVDGPSLSEFGTVPMEQAFGWLKPICETLDFIHEQGIVHRDIKPENIRLHPERGPILLDFGIAKDVSLDLTQSTVMMGTPLYMAPEQLDAASVTGAADQYAVAMMTYRWLSGRFPWDENASRSRIDLAKLMGKLLPLSEVKGDLPEGLSDALMRGLSIEPSERYGDCVGFYGALFSVSGVEGVSEAIEDLGGTRIVSPASSTGVVSSPVQPTVESTNVVSSAEDVGSTRVLKEDSVAQTTVSKSVAKSEEPSSASATVSDVEVPKGSSGVGLKVVAGLLLLGGLGYGGYAYMDSVEQSGFQSRVDEISKNASRFDITVPSGRLSKEIVSDFEQLVSEQIRLGSRVDEISDDAERFGINVPSGRLSESQVSSFEREVSERLVLIGELEQLHSTKLIPAGSFWMGCNSTGYNNCNDDEGPAHFVTINQDFLMMDREVTQGLYKKVTGKSPSYFSGSNRPVENVSWFDAVAFANALSELEGLEPCYEISGKSVSWSNTDCKGWRLPTEAEWEYAARGGQSYKYAGSNSVGDVAWYWDNGDEKTHNVCSKKRNGYGLCDMSGNVYEWVWDWKGSYSSTPTVDPRGPTSGSARVSRGGSWYNDARIVRVSDRDLSDDPTVTYSNLGFRLCRSP